MNELETSAHFRAVSVPKVVRAEQRNSRIGKRDRKSVQILPRAERAEFWKYCIRASNQAILRSRLKGLPCSIDAYHLDQLLVDQRHACALSGIRLITTPAGQKRGPFGPSLDRIVPAHGYVPGNVRIVCNMVNLAMSNWGESALMILLEAFRDREFPK